MSYDSLARDRLTYSVTVLEPLYNQYAQSGFTDRARAEQFYFLSYKWAGEVTAQKLFSETARAQIDDNIERQLDGQYESLLRRASGAASKFGFEAPGYGVKSGVERLPDAIVEQAGKLGKLAQDWMKWLLPVGAVLVAVYLFAGLKK